MNHQIAKNANQRGPRRIRQRDEALPQIIAIRKRH